MFLPSLAEPGSPSAPAQTPPGESRRPSPTSNFPLPVSSFLLYFCFASWHPLVASGDRVKRGFESLRKPRVGKLRFCGQRMRSVRRDRGPAHPWHVLGPVLHGALPGTQETFGSATGLVLKRLISLQLIHQEQFEQNVNFVFAYPPTFIPR